jgi:type II secretory pathway pseudopilin PulG
MQRGNGKTSLDLVEDDYSGGALDKQNANIYREAALSDPTQLPAKYRSSAIGKDATYWPTAYPISLDGSNAGSISIANFGTKWSKITLVPAIVGTEGSAETYSYGATVNYPPLSSRAREPAQRADEGSSLKYSWLDRLR